MIVERGACPVCGRRVELNALGMIAQHPRNVGDDVRYRKCPGALRDPDPRVPVTRHAVTA